MKTRNYCHRKAKKKNKIKRRNEHKTDDDKHEVNEIMLQWIKLR